MSKRAVRGLLGGRWSPLRALRWLVVVGLLPVVLVAGPGASGAYAASNYTEPAVASIQWEDMSHYWPPGDDVMCSFEGFWETTDADMAILRVHGGNCTAGSAFDYQDEHPDVTSVVTAIFWTDGQVCGFPVSMEITDGGAVVDYDLLNGQAEAVPLAEATGCGAVDSVCASIDLDTQYDGLGFAHGEATCTAVAVGLPEGAPETPSGCPVSALQPVSVSGTVSGTGSSGSYTYSVTVTSTSMARIRVLLWIATSSHSAWGYAEASHYTAGTGSQTFTGSGSGDFGGGGALDLKGIQVIGTETWTAAQSTATGGPNSTMPYSAGLNYWNYRDATNDYYMGGATWPERCSWYYGAKIAESPDNYDEPYAPLGGTPGGVGEDPPAEDVPPLPDDDGGGCDFKITDPSTWASAGVCALVEGIWKLIRKIGSAVSLLGEILGALGGLAGDIASGILDGLGALFIPSAGFFDDALADFQTDFNGPELQAWTDAFGEAFDGDTTAGTTPITFASGGSALLPGSSCSGPGIRWDKFTEMGVGDIYPISSCSGVMSQVAAAVKLILTGLIGIASLIKCFGIVAAALGFTKDTPTLQPDARGV